MVKFTIDEIRYVYIPAREFQQQRLRRIQLHPCRRPAANSRPSWQLSTLVESLDFIQSL